VNLHAPNGTRSVELPSSVEAPGAIRAFLRAALTPLPGDATSVVELLATELVSNVVRHVGSPMTVRVASRGPAIRIEVDDDSGSPPVLLHPAPDAESGRGLLLVEALACEWGWNARDQGKTVWFVVDPDETIDIRASAE